MLSGFDEVLPAGTYSVETDEELLDGLSFRAYKRTQTRLRLQPGGPGRGGRVQTLTIDPDDLEAALTHDRMQTDAPSLTDAARRSAEGTLSPVPGAAAPETAGRGFSADGASRPAMPVPQMHRTDRPSGFGH
jgi:hypothetical protein